MTHVIMNMKGLENCILNNSRRNKLVILLFMQSCSSVQHIVLNLQLVPVLHIPLFNVWYKLKNSIMNNLKTVKILLSPLRLHSASSIQIPQSTIRYNSMLPSVYVSPLKLHSATKINLHGVSDSALFRNHLKVCLSPLKSPVLRNSRSKYRRSVVYPSISKCNAKRCSCCKHLCCKSTIKSNVNGRQFSVITNSDLD